MCDCVLVGIYLPLRCRADGIPRWDTSRVCKTFRVYETLGRWDGIPLGYVSPLGYL